RAGLPGRARRVARVLSANDDPALPWHRVLRSDGRIALPPGSAGWREQSQRLREEGVQVTEGRVRMPPPSGGDGLDALLWGRRRGGGGQVPAGRGRMPRPWGGDGLDALLWGAGRDCCAARHGADRHRRPGPLSWRDFPGAGPLSNLPPISRALLIINGVVFL